MQIHRLFYFALVLALTCSCSTSRRAEKPPLVSYGLSLARSIAEEGGIGQPRGVAPTFSCEDKEVLAFLRFDNLAGRYQLHWNWYTPDGSLYLSSGAITASTAENGFYRAVTAWHALTIRGDKAARLPGQWRVDVYINEDLLDRKTFTLNAAQTSESLPGVHFK